MKTLGELISVVFILMQQPKLNDHFVETDGIMALACNSSTWSN